MKRYVCIISLLLCLCGLCRAQKPFQPDSLRMFEYSNDTIRQSVEVSLLDDLRISFKLTTENKLRKKTAVRQGVATNKQKDFGASETDEDETGSLYPVVEYTYGGDCWLAFRFDEKYGRLRIKEADNEKPVSGCPLKSVGVLTVKKEKASVYRTTTDTINLYRAFIESQKRIETDEQEFDNPYQLSKKDLLIALPLIKQGLRQYQYKDLSDEEFRIKVKQYFGVDICDAKSVSPLAIRTKVHPEYTTLFIEKMDGNIETLHRMEYDLPFYTHNLFISHRHRLITEMPLLKDIITVTGENEYKVQFRYENVVHRNKYLFNDDSESLRWLKVNDSGFLKFLNKKN